MVYIFIALVLLLIVVAIVLRNKKPLPATDISQQQNQAIISLKSQLEFLQLQNQEQSKNISQLQQINIELERNLATSNANQQHLKETNIKLSQQYQQVEAKFLAEFQNLAQKALEEKSHKFVEINQKNFQPVFDGVAKALEELKISQAKQETDFGNQIANLMKETSKIGLEANNLVSALKNPKYQGNWGEMILEIILENSGLIEGEHYIKNYSVNNEEGKRQIPDFLIKVPNNNGDIQQHIVVDAKVSLTAYEKYCNSHNPKDQQIFLEDHLKSLKKHLSDLAVKQYHSTAETKSVVDFTIAFIPIEPAYLLAMQADRQLWLESFKKKVLLVSPTNFIVCLKIIGDLWSRQKQNQNALAIVNQAERLYEKIIGFTESVDKIGSALDNANKHYNEAIKKFRDGKGNVASQIEKLKDLGLRSNKKLPQNLTNTESDDDDTEGESTEENNSFIN